MNFQKTRTLSSEVFQMLRQIYENQRVSELEKDILKEKLRHLYEALDEVSQTGFVEKKQEEAVPIRPAEQSDPTLRAHDLAAELKAVQEEDYSESEEAEEEKPEEMSEIEDEPEDLLDFSQGLGFNRSENGSAEQPLQAAIKFADPEAVSVKPAPASEPKPETKVVQEVITVSRAEEPAPAVQQRPVSRLLKMEPEVEELFVIEEGKELLDKLRSTPLADLSKAMTLNDKMFYAKELFNNDTSLLNQTLLRLNDFGSFEDAKLYLSEEYVQKYSWTSADKKKTAKEIIRLVKRRYIS
jgi:hypothetical protein